MSRYRNSCGCERCRCRGLMGPAILVTLGVLLLMSEMHVIGFDYTWPVLLIVIGVVKVLQSNASMEGHVNAFPPYPGYPGYPVAAPPAPVQPTAPGIDPNQGEVHHG